MEYSRDHIYPNGWTKSRLFEVFLTHHHFGITDEEYELNVEFVKIDEKNGERNCTWFKDTDDRLVVAQLQFEDRELRLAITGQGFELIRKPPAHRKVKVFICYAREDLESAKRMFANLKEEGFQPWFDQEGLMPGQRWEIGIEKAIRTSQYFIPLLSSHSVEHTGYVQKEILRALEILERMPPSGIFIIPSRLDNCSPSHPELEKLNRVDMFPDWDAGLQKILKVLKTRG
jgi:hypothetical protein